jgi:succinyl-CoA synthetase beta subunit
MANQMSGLLASCYECFKKTDATLLEINPVGVTLEGHVLACDVKLNIDDNAHFRQAPIFRAEDLSQKNWK